MLEKNLKENDYENLYQNLYSNEDSILKKLKNFSSELNTRNGLNKRCAEKIIEKTKIDLSRMKVIEKFMKIESFINKTRIEVLIEVQDQKQIQKSKSKNQKNEKLDSPTILIQLESNEIKQFLYLNKIVQGDKRKNEYLIRNIKEFIKQFNDRPWKRNEKILGIGTGARSGARLHDRLHEDERAERGKDRCGDRRCRHVRRPFVLRFLEGGRRSACERLCERGNQDHRVQQRKP